MGSSQKKRKFLHEHQTRRAEPQRVETQSAAQHIYRPTVQQVLSSNYEQLSDSLGFGWKHPGRPKIKDALKDAETPIDYSSLCSKEFYDLAVKFCNQKGQELWPNTNGRHWPSWPEESELYVSLLALIFKTHLIVSGSSNLLPTFFLLKLTGTMKPRGDPIRSLQKPT